ncbi:putative FAS-associated death domain protein-like isoform 2 [Scophthalmus maximus]|uniref:Putative FAS-associated death domain protein-like isoform 2 n=1 Tax=Scophthalmus maximus TaxID=52904 RepID=A0A2U9BZW2_SCOMX|nr:putative FAS-associated death domain protein-like isoform 2 [Scophthalmus maximus]
MHADSRGLLSPHGYQQVKACRVPGEKVTELLDHIIQRGPEAAQGLLELLKEQALQETFPLLHFVKDLHVRSLSSETTRKKRDSPELQEIVPFKKPCSNGSRLVTEKQLMAAARAVGRSWREIGRLALDIPSVKLEQIEEDHSLHVERVFAMLHYWRNCQREKATAAHLHSLLSQEDFALPPERIDFLLEAD